METRRCLYPQALYISGTRAGEQDVENQSCAVNRMSVIFLLILTPAQLFFPPQPRRRREPKF